MLHISTSTISDIKDIKTDTYNAISTALLTHQTKIKCNCVGNDIHSPDGK